MKRFIPSLVLFLCVCCLIGCSATNKKESKVSEKTPKELTEEEITEILTQSYDEYNAGKITYYEARDTIVSIKGAGLVSKNTVNLAEKKLEELQASKAYYDLAVDCMKKERYLEAMECYCEVIEEDTLYPQALTGYEKAERAYIDESMKKAEAEYERKNYPVAIEILNTCNDNLDDDNQEVLNQVIKYELDYVQDSLQRAQNVFDTKGDYYEALSILRVTHTNLSFHYQDLQDAMDLYLSYQPVALKDLAMFMGDGEIHYTDSSISDNFGNSYRGYYYTSFSYSPKSFFYAINGKYDVLSGTVFIKNEDKNKYCGYIEIYGDGKKLFESNEMEPGTKPQQFSVSVTGIAQLEFRIHPDYDLGKELNLANVLLEKSIPAR